MEQNPHYDVIVAGAGPGGCEAALAAAAGGARALLLTINLDSIGYPPATPVLIEEKDDLRGKLLAEIGALGARLPSLLESAGVVRAGGPDGADGPAGAAPHRSSVPGRLVVDRRRLGLAWKEAVESEPGLELRQTLVTSISPDRRDGSASWLVRGNLGESFTGKAVVIAAGTSLKGRVRAGGVEVPGGRRGEIPADSLANCLQNMGLELVSVSSSCRPRIAGDSLGHGDSPRPEFVADGRQLAEVLGPPGDPRQDRRAQLDAARLAAGDPGAWVTRTAYAVHHLVLAAGQVSRSLESISFPGLWFAGRAAGAGSYLEAAATGILAGRSAANPAGHGGAPALRGDMACLDSLAEAVAKTSARPVTIYSRPPAV